MNESSTEDRIAHQEQRATVVFMNGMAKVRDKLCAGMSGAEAQHEATQSVAAGETALEEIGINV